MEVSNLLISKRADIVEKLLKSYSTNEEMREKTILQLLSPGVDKDGNRRNSLNMDLELDIENSSSVSRNILERYFNVLGYSIINNIEEEK